MSDNLMVFLTHTGHAYRFALHAQKLIVVTWQM